MFGQGIRLGWTAALLALAFTVFAVAPTVEAATCASEAAVSQSLADSISAADHDDDGCGPEASHVSCHHGHCHHGSSASQPGVGDIVVPPSLPLAYAMTPDDRALLRAPGGLERPPRG